MPTMQVIPKLLPLIQKPKRFKIIVGGRGSGKSQGIADICLMDAQTKSIKIACFREFQNSIEDSVHSLLKGEIERLEIQGYESQNNVIRHSDGGEFKFKGLARNIESVKSMSGFDRVWVEEAQTISADSLKMLVPTIRAAGSEIWMTANPTSSGDPFSQRFIVPFQDQLFRDGYYEDDLHLIILVNYSDNPFFPVELENDRLWDMDNLPRAQYDHIWEGKFNDSVENSIILAEWFDAAIDSHRKLGFKPTGIKLLAHDPSDSGDAKAIAVRHGSVITHCEQTKDGDVNDACDWATSFAIDERVDNFLWDGDGLGVSLTRQVGDSLRGKSVIPVMFRGSESAERPYDIYQEVGDKNQRKTNKETFLNKRAQMYWELRDRFFNTYRAVTKGEYIDPDHMISISSSIKELQNIKAEICRIPRKFRGDGMIQIMSKKEMARKGIKSPNMADCIMMLMDTPQLADAIGTYEIPMRGAW
jgi:phage terminase large subunit